TPVTLLSNAIAQRQYLQEEMVVRRLRQRLVKLAIPELKVFDRLRLLPVYQAFVHASKIAAGGLAHNQCRHERLDQQASFHEFSRAGLVQKKALAARIGRWFMSRTCGKCAAAN